MSTRLPGAKYKFVFDSGRVLKGRLMSAWVVRHPDAGRQAGVVVSKKSFHDAVDRNRAKRIMREAFRLSVDFVPEEFHADRAVGKACRENFERIAAYAEFVADELNVVAFVTDRDRKSVV